MRRLIIAMAMLAMTSGAYAGPAVEQLESMSNIETLTVDIQVPAVAAPADATEEDGDMKKWNPRPRPGYPKPPHQQWCGNHHGFPTCRGIAKSAGTDDKSFDEKLAKANCSFNPNAPGCPSYCRDNKMYPGCPMFCQMNVWHKACGYVPLYCKTNPNGFRCPKSAKSAETADKTFDESLAKANCSFNPNAPGCPGYCRDHKMYPGCPMYCQVNPWHKACGHVPSYCHTNPNGYGCPKAVGAGEEKSLADITDEAEAKSFCSKHKMRPGCPMFCQMNIWHKSCGYVPLYCKTNPNGYRCPKALEADTKANEDGDMKKFVPGYPQPPHPQWCSNHHGFPTCR